MTGFQKEVAFGAMLLAFFYGFFFCVETAPIVLAVIQ